MHLSDIAIATNEAVNEEKIQRDGIQNSSGVVDSSAKIDEISPEENINPETATAVIPQPVVKKEKKKTSMSAKDYELATQIIGYRLRSLEDAAIAEGIDFAGYRWGDLLEWYLREVGR